MERSLLVVRTELVEVLPRALNDQLLRAVNLLFPQLVVSVVHENLRDQPQHLMPVKHTKPT